MSSAKTIHWKLIFTTWLLCSFHLIGNCHGQATAIRWDIKHLAVDANEGIDLADFNRDGKLDIVAGRNWYAAPNYVARPIHTIDDWNGYVESNGDHAYDVNGDGWIDVIAGSFLPTKVYWYENPGQAGLSRGQLWQKHLLVDTSQSRNEGQLLVDVFGDNRPEWIVNSWAADSPLFVWSFTTAQSRDSDQSELTTLESVQVGERGNGHGLAIGDLNNDGHVDIATGKGWFANPGDAKNPWTFRADWDVHASVPFLIHDVDDDGRSDIIIGNAHDYGLFWWKQLAPDDSGATQWEKVLIDKQFSQPHCLHLADLDGDGRPELITGKRVRAHNGNDPGGGEPACLYYYQWRMEARKFERYVIEEGHVGTGLQIRSGDLDGDNRLDLAVAGKSGTYLLFNKIHSQDRD